MGANQPIKNGNWEEKRFGTKLSNSFLWDPGKPGVRSMGLDGCLSLSPHLFFVIGVDVVVVIIVIVVGVGVLRTI